MEKTLRSCRALILSGAAILVFCYLSHYEIEVARGFLVPLLKTITVNITVFGLHALGILSYSDGYIIGIPEGSFEIEDGCSGLNYLISSCVFGCFFAVVVYQSLLGRILFIALSITVSIVANGLRAIGVIALAHFVNNTVAVKTHYGYGWLFFTLVIMALAWIGEIFKHESLKS